MKIFLNRRCEYARDSNFLNDLVDAWNSRYMINSEWSIPSSYSRSCWQWNPYFGAIYISNADRMIRAYLRNMEIYAPRATTLTTRYIAYNAFSHKHVFEYTSKCMFSLSDVIPNQECTIVLPGRDKITTFDLKSMTSMIVSRSGNYQNVVDIEATARSLIPDRLAVMMPPIVSYDTNRRWMEQRLVPGFNLARCPPWWPKRKVEAALFGMLSNWEQSTRREERASKYVARLYHWLTCAIASCSDSGVMDWSSATQDLVIRLAALAEEHENLELVQSHGDLQPANIVASFHDLETPTLVDWEHFGTRSYHYDYLVYRLATRWPAGLEGRLRCADSVFADYEAMFPEAPRPTNRSAALALFLLEDMLWSFEANARQTTQSGQAALQRFVSEIEAFEQSGLRHAFRTGSA